MASHIFPRHGITLRDSEQNVMVPLLTPFFVGLVVNYFFWGIQIIQSYQYYRSFWTHDKAWFKAAVIILLLTDLAQTVCASELAWSLLVDFWGDTNFPAKAGRWGLNFLPLTDATTPTVVHIFYAQRIFTFLNPPYNIYCAVTVTFLALVRFVSSLGATITISAFHLITAKVAHIKVWLCISLGTATLNDIFITLVMVSKLSTSRTGIKRTDDILIKLTLLVVETGLAPTVVQVAALLMYLVFPSTTTYWLALVYFAPKVYGISMLALLNSRPSRNTNDVVMSSISISNHPRIEIQATTSVQYTIDPVYPIPEPDKVRAFHDPPLKHGYAI